MSLERGYSHSKIFILGAVFSPFVSPLLRFLSGHCGETMQFKTAATTMSVSSDDKAAKKARKQAMKVEAESMGITYKELKSRQKKREATLLHNDDKEHETELKRMRTWSKDFPNEPQEKKRRTRSMDAASPEKDDPVSPEEWMREHAITVQGHGIHAREKVFATPFLKFTDAPYNQAIQRALQQAGFSKPTHIQSQVRSFSSKVYTRDSP